MALINKKGYLRIIEVMLAITLLSGAILYTYSSKQVPDGSSEEYFRTYHKEILSEIAVDSSLRALVLDGRKEELLKEIEVPKDLGFELVLCEMTSELSSCNMKGSRRAELVNNGVGISSDETIIVSDLEEYNPMKVKLFLWEDYDF